MIGRMPGGLSGMASVHEPSATSERAVRYIKGEWVQPGVSAESRP
jgi:hypothetical protein